MRTFLAVLLTSALFCIPAMSLDQEFGHTHPEGTPPHFHSLSGILTAAASPTITGVGARQAPILIVQPQLQEAPVTAPLDRASPIRAPPILQALPDR